MPADTSIAPTLSVVPAPEADCRLTAELSVAGIKLDRVLPSDEPFLYETFASTRADEVALTGWSAGQQEAFLRMQYEAQRSSYRMQIPHAEYWVIRSGETAVGRLIIDWTPEEIHIADIALLPEFRRRGLGSALMQAIMREAARTAKAVGLYVERFNPALHWYERLGFIVVGSGPVYLEMLWRAAQPHVQEQDVQERDIQESGLGVAYADSSD
jgi:ribosomal protein S18 acetylase RimI-like enzyme